MTAREKTRYAIVGLGSRSAMYGEALLSAHSADRAPVAYCDVNQTHMDYYNRRHAAHFGVPAAPTYRAEESERVLDQQHVDTVIVTSIDRTHHRYSSRTMEHGCNVITEKPLTVDAAKSQAILPISTLVWLCSPGARFVTGFVTPVDHGITAFTSVRAVSMATGRTTAPRVKPIFREPQGK